jgi:hypothetical protein
MSCPITYTPTKQKFVSYPSLTITPSPFFYFQDNKTRQNPSAEIYGKSGQIFQSIEGGLEDKVGRISHVKQKP